MQIGVTDMCEQESPFNTVPYRWLVFGAAIIMVVCSCVAGCTGTGSNSGTPPGPERTTPAVISTTSPVVVTAALTTTTGGPSVTVDLVAKDMAFNVSTITVPAGASVIVNFHNREPPGSSQVTGIAHNFALYDTPAAAIMIFSGEIITGGGDAVYRFTAPAIPGTYFFRCDVHPALMNGQFVVQ
jgi:plastocyanin